MTEDILAPYGDFTPEALAALNLRRLDFANAFADERPYHIKALIEDLQQTRLGVYITDLGQALIGVEDERLHRHERWLYLHSPELMEWHRIRHHGQALSSPLLIPGNVASTRREMQRHRADAATGGLPFSILDYWRARAYPYVNVAGTMERFMLKSELTPVELHELVFHVDAWQARHPEFEGMPGEVIWRLHGLGQAYEYARDNRLEGDIDEDAFQVNPMPIAGGTHG
jgi:hypothetical protein